MIKIIKPLALINQYLFSMKLQMSQPQIKHLQEITDALIMCESRKTLSDLQRSFLTSTHATTWADFFSESPWDENDVKNKMQSFMMRSAIQDYQKDFVRPKILISIDDSHSLKPKASRHFEPVGWHYDPNQGRGAYAHGISFVTLHVRIGQWSFPFSFRLYMREQTIRQLNKTRYKDGRKALSFNTKNEMAQDMLNEIAQFLPEGWPVYVLFDSWYSSEKLIRFCRGHHWHVICSLKHNRCFNNKALFRISRRLRSKSWSRTRINSPESSAVYWTCVKNGLLKGISEEISVIFSKRNHKDKRPAFFLCTDRSLSVHQALTLYSQRWEIETDYLYLKTRLGLGDFRIRRLEGISRWIQVVLLAFNYLAWRRATSPSVESFSISDIISQHRREQSQETLTLFAQEVLRQGKIAPVVERFLAAA